MSQKWRNYSSTYMVHTKLTIKSPEKHSQQIREEYRDCFINEHVVAKVLYIQPLNRA